MLSVVLEARKAGLPVGAVLPGVQTLGLPWGQGCKIWISFCIFLFISADCLLVILQHFQRGVLYVSPSLVPSMGGSFGKKFIGPLLGQKQNPPDVDFSGGKG